MDDEFSDDFEVGYGKPPVHSQFTKGTSGNPKGRPKGSKSLSAMIRKEGLEKIRVREGNRIRSLTKFEAIIKQLSTQALQGNRSSSNDFINYNLMAEQAEASGTNNHGLVDADRRMIASLRQRLAAEGDHSQEEK